jgi:hypothetical protein
MEHRESAMPSNRYLTLDDLAALLRRPRSTILKDRLRNPDAVPPAVKLPNTRHILFDYETVDRWMKAREEGQIALVLPPPPPRRGRPRKPV